MEHSSWEQEQRRLTFLCSTLVNHFVHCRQETIFQKGHTMKLLKCKWLSWLVSYRNLKQRFHLASLFSVTNKTTHLLRPPWFLEDEVPRWFSPCWSFNLLLTLSPLPIPPCSQKPHCFLLSIPCFSSPPPPLLLAVPSSAFSFNSPLSKSPVYVSHQ